MTYQEIAATLAEQITLETWTPWLDTPDGARVRAKLEPDYDSDPFDGDDMGQVYDSRDGSRPKECDGAARKVDTRSGPMWWQPPEDVAKDAALLSSVEKRVRGYFHEYWSYVGVVVERESTPCECCGERKRTGASLWAVESDAGEYFAEVLTDLLHDAGVRE